MGPPALAKGYKGCRKKGVIGNFWMRIRFIAIFLLTEFHILEPGTNAPSKASTPRVASTSDATMPVLVAAYDVLHNCVIV